MIGLAIGRHVENGGARHAYAGLQFAFAVIVSLAPDSYADAAIAPALARLGSILIGMAILEPVLLAWHAFAPNHYVPQSGAGHEGE